MPAEQLIAAFAARRQEMERIVADIAAQKPQSRAQHHLVIAQRGMGKTMLLARIAVELRTVPELSARFIPLMFAEEQYAVDRLSKFWLNCLDSLADARELVKDAAGVAGIDATVARLTAAGPRAAKDDQPLADEAYEAFAHIARAGGQRPVLLVDNLRLVFGRLDGGQQHSLRELLMRPGSPILVGASPGPPPQSRDYGAALYDQFKVHDLGPLDESEMRSLLLHLADAAQRADVRERILQHPARLTVLRQLTGGNPRTALTLFFLYAEDFAPHVFGDLEGLLDRVTALYKARFEELTAQQQVIASAIANHWDPVTAAGLANATGLPAGTVSAQLDRLEKTGIVERTALFGQASTGYQFAERAFNIWFLMRSASRRQRRQVELLTRFLERFYEPADRSRLARHLMGEDHGSRDRYVSSRAVAGSLTERETAEELTRHAELAALREEAREARSRLGDLVDFGSVPPAALAFDDLRRQLMSLVPDDAGVNREDFAKAVLGDRAMFIGGERDRLAARPRKLTDAEIHSVREMIRKARVADERAYSADAVAWFSHRLASGQIRACKDAGDWNRAFLQAIGQRCIQLMVDSLPTGFGTVLEDASVARIRSAIKPISTAPAWLWFGWACDLHLKLARYVEAETAYREAIARDPKDPWPWFGLGNLLQFHLQRYAEAETAYREAAALGPELAGPWTSLGHLLQYHLQRYADAETAYREAIARGPESACPWIGLGNLYCDHLDRPSDAAPAYDHALRLDLANDVVHQSRIFLRRDLMGEGPDARPLMDGLRELPSHELPDTTHLHDALFAAYDANWGLASEALANALTHRAGGLSPVNTDDWLRASAVLLHLNYGSELLAVLDRRGDTARLRPWVEAVRAHHLGDRRALQNVAPEIRTAAEIVYDGIEGHLKKLPDKTNRRPAARTRRARAKRR